MKRKILLYGDLSLNVVDGSSVWLSSLAKLLAEDKNNIVDILLKVNITNNIIVKDFIPYDNITLLNADEYIPKYNTVDTTNIVKIISEVDEYRDYSCIIVRGFEAVKQLVKNDTIASKLIPYLTDFCHIKENMQEEEKNILNFIYNKVNKFFVQTIQMKEYLKDVLGIDGNKFEILSPMIFQNTTKKVLKESKTIVYAGKIAKDWNILELIEIMDELYKKDKEITLHMIGDKFNRDLAERRKEIIAKLS